MKSKCKTTAAVSKTTTPARLVAAAGLAAYLGVTQLALGLHTEHLVLAGLFALMVLVGGRAFRFTLLLLPCICTGIAYDYVRLLKSLRGEVHVADLYHAELTLFGIGDGSQQQVPALYFLEHTHAILDFACGLSYILYVYVPFALAIAMFFLDQRRMVQIGLVLFVTNLFGMILYLLYPAAPPWYVAEYGLGPARFDVLPSAAGAIRFDALVGFDYFERYYSRSANVYGAMPSLHVAYPFGTALVLRSRGLRWSGPLTAFALLVAFAAIYLQHHYILDVIAGLACAVVAHLLVSRLMRRAQPAASAPADDALLPTGAT